MVESGIHATKGVSASLATEISEGNNNSSVYVREEGALRKKQAGCQSKIIKIKTAIFHQFSAILVVKQDRALSSIVCRVEERDFTIVNSLISSCMSAHVSPGRLLLRIICTILQPMMKANTQKPRSLLHL